MVNSSGGPRVEQKLLTFYVKTSNSKDNKELEEKKYKQFTVELLPLKENSSPEIRQMHYKKYYYNFL